MKWIEINLLSLLRDFLLFSTMDTLWEWDWDGRFFFLFEWRLDDDRLDDDRLDDETEVFLGWSVRDLVDLSAIRVGWPETTSASSSGYIVNCWPETISADSSESPISSLGAIFMELSEIVVARVERALWKCSDGRETSDCVLLTGPFSKEDEIDVVPITEWGFVCSSNFESVTDITIDDDVVLTSLDWDRNTVGTSTFTEEVPSVIGILDGLWKWLWKNWYWKGVVDGLYKQQEIYST